MAEKTTLEEQKDKLKKINDVFKLIKEKEIKMIDLRFTDLPGQWQHLTIPVSKLSESSFYEGIGFDGSSIRGWKNINDSDMLAVPDPATGNIDPFTCKSPTSKHSFQVANIKIFAPVVFDQILKRTGKPILSGVVAPTVAGAGLRHHQAIVAIADDVAPGSGCYGSRYHILSVPFSEK